MSRWRTFASPDPALAGRLVLAFDASRPDENYAGVAELLKVESFTGRVLFDLLTCNGAGKRRFFLLDFDGEQFDLTRLERLEAPAQHVRKAVTALLFEHAKSLDLAVLTPAQRFAVRNSVVL